MTGQSSSREACMAEAAVPSCAGTLLRPHKLPTRWCQMHQGPQQALKPTHPLLLVDAAGMWFAPTAWPPRWRATTETLLFNNRGFIFIPHTDMPPRADSFGWETDREAKGAADARACWSGCSELPTASRALRSALLSRTPVSRAAVSSSPAPQHRGQATRACIPMGRLSTA